MTAIATRLPAAPWARARSSVVLGALVAALGTAAFLGAAAGRFPVPAVALGAAALVGVAVLAQPQLATLVVVALLYSNAAVVAVNYHGVPASVAFAVPVLLAAPVADVLLRRREGIVVPRAVPWLVAFLLVQLVGAALSDDPAAAASDVGAFAVEGIGLYLLVVNAVRSTDLLRKIVWTLLACGFLLATLSVFQAATATYDDTYLGFAQVNQGPDRDPGVPLPEDAVRRVAGPIGEQNRYGQALLVLVPLSLAVFRSERTGARRFAACAAGAFVTVAMALTYSRGAAVGFAVVLVAMVAIRQIRLAHLVSLAAGAGLLLLLLPAYRDRISTIGSVTEATAAEGEATDADGSFRSRATENLAALYVFADHPLVGVGPGLFPEHYAEYAERVAIRVKDEQREAHNLYLQIAAETGALGLAAFLGAVGVTIGELVRARHRALATRPATATLLGGFLLALIAYLVTGVFLHLSYARYFWLLLALAGAAAAVAAREQAAEMAAAVPAGAPVGGRPPRRVVRRPQRSPQAPRYTLPPMPLSPDDITSREFAVTLRGLDPDEVAAFLRQVADELRAAREAAAVPAPVPVEASALDPATVGEEVARVLSAANDAAISIRSQAETAAASMRDAAQQEAQEIREAAQREAAAARESADRDIQAARQAAEEEVQGLRSRVEQEAYALREAAERDAGRTRDDAIAAKAQAENDAQATRNQAQKDARRTVEAAQQEAQSISEAAHAMRAQAEEEGRNLLRGAHDRAESIRQAAEASAADIRRRTEEERRVSLDEAERLLAAARQRVEAAEHGLKDWLAASLDQLRVVNDRIAGNGDPGSAEPQAAQTQPQQPQPQPASETAPPPPES